MSKEQATLLGELMMLKAHHPTFMSKIGFVDGKVFFEAEPIELPFSVKDGEVHMVQAKVDDAREHAIDAAETFRNAFKNYREEVTRASATSKVALFCPSMVCQKSALYSQASGSKASA